MVRHQFGIIDDIKTNAFSNNSWNEIIEVAAVGTLVGGKYITTVDVSTSLKYANVISGSFLSTVGAVLNPVNGIITFPPGTELNVDLNGGGIPSGIRAIVNYRYFVPNIPGDDSTLGSRKSNSLVSKNFFRNKYF